MKKKNKLFYIIFGLIIIVSLTGILLLNGIDNKKNDSLKDPISEVYNNEIGNILNYHSEKIILYLFYGSGCPHCENELLFLNEMKEKYGKYIELRIYETFSNENNYNLMNKIKKHFNIEKDGVPFTVIGNQAFIGFNDNTKPVLENRIVECITSIYPEYVEDGIEYKDVVSEITNENKDKMTLYLFYGEECPHCEDEKKFLEDIKDKYKKYLNIELYETWHNKKNNELLTKVKEKLNFTGKGVPFTLIGEDYYSGYSDSTGKKIESSIIKYIKVLYPDANIDEEFVIDKSTEEIPFLGNINVRNASMITISIILGFVDGFNPCAMWILLFLIGMLFNMKDKKRMYILGYTFLLVSSIFYFFAVFFLDIIIGYMAVKVIRYLIGLVGILGGAYNLYKYFNDPKDGCSTTSNSKRKKIMERIKKFTSEKNLLLALIGVILLAVSVNLVEIMCTTGFPTIFVSILELNKIVGIEKIMYLLIYIIMYMIDDFVVFIVSMVTLEITGVSTKFNRLSHLIGGILMILIGILLIFKYEWLMFNF